jgi:oligopeptide transport system ATP-binding protein
MSAAAHSDPQRGSADGEILLSVRDVKKHFKGRRKRHDAVVYAVDGVSFDVVEGETLGLVGESGCGKSTLARVLTGLYRPTSGSIQLRGVDLRARGARRRIRGGLQMVFQDPSGSLDPRRRLGDSVAEPLHGQGRGKQRRLRAAEMLERVGLDPALGDRYPHQLSGGQQQRACIARALISDPSLIVLDEALSSLDVSLQAQVVDLLRKLQTEFRGSYVFITHDLATAFELSTRVAIMYLGEIVELVPVEDFQSSTLHPYSKALIDAILVPDPEIQRTRKPLRLHGEIPSAANPPSGCRFHTRCPYAQEICVNDPPVLRPFGPDHWAACHFAGTLTFSSGQERPNGAVAPTTSPTAADSL